MSFCTIRGISPGMPESQRLRYQLDHAKWEELRNIEQKICKELYPSDRKRLTAVNSTGGFGVTRSNKKAR